MRIRQNLPRPLFRQEFSDWMYEQNRWNQDVQDNIITRITAGLYYALIDGILCEDAYDPYLHLGNALKSKNAISADKVLNKVEGLLSRAMADTDSNAPIYKFYNCWKNAWKVYSEFVRTVILPELLSDFERLMQLLEDDNKTVVVEDDDDVDMSKYYDPELGCVDVPRERQDKNTPLYRKKFSGWMHEQKRWKKAVQDTILSKLTSRLHEALTNGELCAEPFDPYKKLYRAIELNHSKEEANAILEKVSDILRSKLSENTKDDKYWNQLSSWLSIWKRYSEFIRSEFPFDEKHCDCSDGNVEEETRQNEIDAQIEQSPACEVERGVALDEPSLDADTENSTASGMVDENSENERASDASFFERFFSLHLDAFYKRLSDAQILKVDDDANISSHNNDAVITKDDLCFGIEEIPADDFLYYLRDRLLDPYSASIKELFHNIARLGLIELDHLPDIEYLRERFFEQITEALFLKMCNFYKDNFDSDFVKKIHEFIDNEDHQIPYNHKAAIKCLDDVRFSLLSNKDFFVNEKWCDVFVSFVDLLIEFIKRHERVYVESWQRFYTKEEDITKNDDDDDKECLALMEEIRSTYPDEEIWQELLDAIESKYDNKKGSDFWRIKYHDAVSRLIEERDLPKKIPGLIWELDCIHGQVCFDSSSNRIVITAPRDSNNPVADFIGCSSFDKFRNESFPCCYAYRIHLEVPFDFDEMALPRILVDLSDAFSHYLCGSILFEYIKSPNDWEDLFLYVTRACPKIGADEFRLTILCE